MKTEDLKAQGLTDEQISFVFAENGKDINALKTENATLRAQNAQLENDKKVLEKEKGDKEKALEDLQKNTITKEEYDKKVKEIEKSAKEEHQNYLFKQRIRQELVKAGVRDTEIALKAVEDSLDLSKITYDGEKDTLTGNLDEQLKSRKETDSYFFETKLGGSNPTEPGGNGTKGDGTPEISMATNFAKEANKSESQEKKSQFFN